MKTLSAVTLLVAVLASVAKFDASAMNLPVQNSDVYIQNMQLLFSAAEKGDVNAAKMLIIGQGTDVNAKDSLGNTPLHYAAMKGHYNLVKVLVENHAEINARNNEGYTSLHLAAQNGHGDVVKFLIQNGAIVNIEDVYGFTPLDRAIIFGDENVVKVLINRGALINIKDENEWTPLHRAALCGSVDIVKLLMQNRANIFARTNGGLRPRDLAVSKEIKRMLVQAEINHMTDMEGEMSRANGPTRLTKEVLY